MNMTKASAINPPSVLITGASSGIGLATARYLVDRNWQVFGASRHIEEASQENPDIFWIPLDVRNDESVRSCINEILRSTNGGKLDALINVAGYSIWGSVEEVSIENIHRQMDTNVYGALRLIQAVLPHFRKNGLGRIINVGSLGGRAIIPFQSHYSASKAALDAFTQALRMELQPWKNIHISLVEPGDINTPFNENIAWVDTDNSPYGDRIKSAEQVVRESLPKAPGPVVIAKTIFKALTAKSPRVRYAAGPDSLAVPWGKRLLPDWLALKLIRDHFKV